MCFAALAPGTSAPSTAVVTKILLPQTIGDECARPSIAVFHLIFLVGLHSEGRFFSLEMPEPSGPLHCGQFPAAALSARKLRPAHANESAMVKVRAIRFTVSLSFLVFSAQPPCSLCLCGCFYKVKSNHRDTENTEVHR